MKSTLTEDGDPKTDSDSKIHGNLPLTDDADESQVSRRWRDAETLLAGTFGLTRFTPPQHKVIDRLFRGRDVLAVLPTGHGKSLCYQLTSQLLPGLTVVVSPLVSLMKDQCDAMNARGIAAVRIDQSLSAEQARNGWQQVRRGHAKLLYLSPERFFNERFVSQLDGRPISLLTIDEAHCLSQWGHAFRPDYLRLAELKDRHAVRQTLLLTATATPAVVTDLRRAFAIESKDCVRLSPHRNNLRIRCTPVASDQRDAVLIDRLKSKPRGPTLIYVTRRATAEQLAETLAQNGIEAMVYHAGMSTAEREQTQAAFVASDRATLIGTVAFGMGVDKPNIRRVIHYNPSQSIEAFSQEIGRGGRDARACQCETLLVPEDRTTLENLPASDLPSASSLTMLLDRLKGQPEHFYLSLGKLGWEINLSTETVATLLIELQTLGYLECLPMRYDTYRVTPLASSETIQRRCHEQDRRTVQAIIASLAKGRRGMRLNLIVAAEKYAIPRQQWIDVLERTAVMGLWNIEASDSMHGYQWVKRISRAKSVVAKLQRQAFDRYEQTVRRVDELMSLMRCQQCLAIGLAAHFGHRRNRPCGKCSFCLDEGPFDTAVNQSASIGRSATVALRSAMDAFPDISWEPIDQAKFLCGLSTPAFRRYRVAKHPGYGTCDRVAFGRVLDSVSES